LPGITLIIILLSFNCAFAEEDLQIGTDPFRLGVGLGIPYGLIGFNLSFRVNSLIEATAGYGTARNGFKAWAVGGRLYPFKDLDKFRPRLSALWGIVGTVRQDLLNDEHRTIDVFEGFAIGAGFDWTFFERHSIDLDLFYASARKSRRYGLESEDHSTVSLGYGYRF
jgi:hypothetical protein